MKTRVFAAILALLMLAAVLPTFADGEPDYTLRIDGGHLCGCTETADGKTILKVDVFLDGITDDKLVTSLDAELLFDTDSLAFVSAESDGVYAVDAAGNKLDAREPIAGMKNGKLVVAFASDFGCRIEEDKPFVTLRFALLVEEDAVRSLSFELGETEAFSLKLADMVPGDDVDLEPVLRTVGASFEAFLGGHNPGEPVKENEVKPTCEVAGGYDEVVYCTVCRKELSREHVDVPAAGHVPGDPVIENEVLPTATEPGGFDTVVYCTVCHKELSREHTVIDTDYVLVIRGGAIEDNTVEEDGQKLFKVDVFVTNVAEEKPLDVLQFVLHYDAGQLTFVKEGLPEFGISIINAEEAGTVEYAFASVEGVAIDPDEPILSLYFTVSDTVKATDQIAFEAEKIVCSCWTEVNGKLVKEVRTVFAFLKPYEYGVLLGDANCDGAVNAADAAAVLRCVVGLAPLSEKGMRNAEVTGDGAVTVSDAATILRYVVKLISVWPIEEP